MGRAAHHGVAKHYPKYWMFQVRMIEETTFPWNLMASRVPRESVSSVTGSSYAQATEMPSDRWQNIQGWSDVAVRQ